MAETAYVISVSTGVADEYKRLGVGTGNSPEQAARQFFGQLPYEEWPSEIETRMLMCTPIRSTHLLRPIVDLNPRLSFIDGDHPDPAADEGDGEPEADAGGKHDLTS